MKYSSFNSLLWTKAITLLFLLQTGSALSSNLGSKQLIIADISTTNGKTICPANLPQIAGDENLLLFGSDNNLRQNGNNNTV